MKRLLWDRTLDTGLEEIDVQHRRFVHLLDRIGQACTSGEAVDKLLEEFRRYAYFHFQSEECLMAVYAWGGVEQQKDEHRRLLEVLDRSIHEFGAGAVASTALVERLYQWFVGHARSEDLAMAQEILAQRPT